MNKQLENKLKGLPKTPGVYFHKDKKGEIIYVGKAANLRNRVRQYFQKSRVRDPKTDVLVNEIADIDWMELETELDALFVEAEMIRRYMPRFNILLRDDKSFVYVRIDQKSSYPSVTFTRRPLDDGATYLGPYTSKFTIARALKYLRRVFPYSTHTSRPKRACLQAQIGLCPGLEAGLTSLDDYRKNLNQLIQYLKGNRKTITKQLEKDMKSYSKSAQYEKAAKARNKLFALKNLEKQIIFSDREHLDISKDAGLVELAQLLGLYKVVEPGDAQRTSGVSGSASKAGRQKRVLCIPRRIEGFDISHMSGTDTVASMVVFVNGVPDKSQYRKFKMRSPGNDDFKHMKEVMTRRFSPSNVKKWGLPDLILIDGGKGQVSSALSILNLLSIDLPLIGLAKRFEEIIIPRQSDIATKSQLEVNRLPVNSNALKLLMRIRDESHRFAVSYHSSLKRHRQTASRLEDIPGIGPATRKKLIKEFGSVRGAIQAPDDQLIKVLGITKAKLIKSAKD